MKKSKIIIIVLTGVAILVAGILTRQRFFLMLPLFVSLFVMSFQSEANRIGALIGACNAVLYTVTYIFMGVYGSAASAFLFSFPLQLMTFFNWKKNAYKKTKTAVFKRMSNKVRVVAGLGGLALWAILAAILHYFKYEYAVLDSITLLFGFIIPVLTMLAYIEYTYLWIVQAVMGLFLNIQMVANDISQLTYLIYGVYALYCVIGAFITVRKFHREQMQIKEG